MLSSEAPVAFGDRPSRHGKMLGHALALIARAYAKHLLDTAA